MPSAMRVVTVIVAGSMMLMLPLWRLVTQTWPALSMASVRGPCSVAGFSGAVSVRPETVSGISRSSVRVLLSSTLTLSWSGLMTQMRGGSCRS